MHSDFQLVENQEKTTSQHDVYDFLVAMCMHIGELCNKNGDSGLASIFGFQTTSNITCMTCSERSTAIEGDMFLSLGINNCSSLSKAIENYFKDEHLEGYVCKNDGCNAQTSNRGTKLHTLPRSLIIQLKRFSHVNNIAAKINRHMTYGESLSLTAFCDGEQSALYELKAVVVHEGSSIDEGHYVAYCKLKESSSYSCYDDAEVYEVSAKKVLDSKAYLLVYELLPEAVDSLQSIANVVAPSESNTAVEDVQKMDVDDGILVSVTKALILPTPTNVDQRRDAVTTPITMPTNFDAQQVVQSSTKKAIKRKIQSDNSEGDDMPKTKIAKKVDSPKALVLCRDCKEVGEHAARSSKLCKKNKAYIAMGKELNSNDPDIIRTALKSRGRRTKTELVTTVKNDGKMDVTIKKSLRGILSKSLTAQQKIAIIKEFKVVTTTVSELMELFSIYINYYFQKKIENDPNHMDYFVNLNDTALRHLMYAVEGKSKQGKVPIDGEFLIMMQRYGVKTQFDVTNMTAICNSEIKKFETNMRNNIILYMRPRLQRFLKATRNMTNKAAYDYAVKLLNTDDDKNKTEIVKDNEFPDFAKLKNRPFEFIPFLYRMQKILFKMKVKSFKVVPENKVRLREVSFDTTGLREFTRRLKSYFGLTTTQIMGMPNRQLWNLLLDVGKLESRRLDKNGKPKTEFNEFMTTNGNEASILMKKFEQSEKLPLATFEAEMSDVVGAVDPGGINPFVAVLVPSISLSTKPTKKEGVIAISAKRWLKMTGQNARKKILEQKTKRVENKLKKLLHKHDNIGQASWRFRKYTQLQLVTFNKKMKCYFRRKIVDLKFQSYQGVQRAVTEVGKALCPPKKKTILFLGKGYEAMNKFNPKGYPRTAVGRMYHHLRTMPQSRCKALLTDEYYTSALCANCYTPFKRNFKAGGSRIKSCPNNACSNKNTNRDVNGAQNILYIRGFHEHYKKPLRQEFTKEFRQKVRFYDCLKIHQLTFLILC